MNWIEVEFSINPLLPGREILIAELSELPFESFEETELGLKAYIREEEFSSDILNNLIVSQLENVTFSYVINTIAAQNWNALWESNFEPIEIEKFCRIRAPFHQSIAGFRQEIIIEPKMSFGTGHHATTWLMIREMFEMNFENKVVLDMGCGTGVLAILAEKLGANRSVGIDIDEWAIGNSIENAEKNDCNLVSIYQGDRNTISGKFDIIIANINRNILVSDMKYYLDALESGGHILFSGFYETDIEEIVSAAGPVVGLYSKRIRDGWCMLHFTKN